MRNLRPEHKVMQNWQGSPSLPMVSILCIAYNHEKFIEDAIEGFLIQETDFPFEILIHDDASTDTTADIIREYEVRYPRLIKPIYQVENQYSKGIKPYFFIIMPRAKGRYLAYCEGDDYWTDSKKLQIQVDFLEANPDYVISGHDALSIDEGKNKIKDSTLPAMYKRNSSGEELILNKFWILTLSWVHRNVIDNYPPEIRMVLNGDNFVLSLLGHYGKGKYHHDIKPACYRSHSGGIWSELELEEKRDAHINTRFWIYRYYKRIGDEKRANAFWKRFEKTVNRRLSISALCRELIVRCFFIRQFISMIRSVLSG